jgi:hypothetical protein
MMFGFNLFADVPFAMSKVVEDGGGTLPPTDLQWCDVCPEVNTWTDSPKSRIDSIRCEE